MTAIHDSRDPRDSRPGDGTPPAVEVTLRAADVARAAANRNGLTYKGFGVLSANATSSMLMDYKAEHPRAYWRLVETLFGGAHPLMTIVKIEMGNDRNNSTGPNAATMRAPDASPNVLREPGFQLAADARRYQPGLHVSILRWNAPTWVRGNDDVYRWYKNTILAAYREFGVMVDSVNPDVNERTPDLRWVEEFARRVREDDEGYAAACADDPNAGWASNMERELFHRIRVITSDEEVTGTFGPALLGDDRLRDAVDIAAYHYSSVDDDQGSFTRLADEYDKEIWNSEAQAVFSNSADRPNNTNDDGLGGRGTGIGGPGGPLEMANTLIKGFVTSRRTCAIYQPAIGANHEHMEYAAKELVSAHDPWSGWIYYDAGCAVLAHFAHFATLGWPGASDRGAGVDVGNGGTVDDADGCMSRGKCGDDGNITADGDNGSGRDSGKNGSGCLGANGDGGDGSVSGHFGTGGTSEEPAIWRGIPQASGCEVGGSNPVNGARHGEPSYLTLAAPDGSAFSTIIVNDSAMPRTYRITVDAALPAAGQRLQVWRTAAATPGERYDAGWMRYVGSVPPETAGTPATLDTPSATSTAPLSGGDAVDAAGAVSSAASPAPIRPGESRAVETMSLASPSPSPSVSSVSSATSSPSASGGAYVFTVTVQPWSMITATTLTDVEPFRAPAATERERAVLDVDPSGGVLYRDDFTYADEPAVSVTRADGPCEMPYLQSRGGDDGAVPRYTTDANGAFEVVPDARRGHALRQQITRRLAGNTWIEGEPRTLIGDMRWTNYRVSVDVLFEPYTGRAPYALLGAREMGGGRFTTDLAAYDFRLQADGLFLLRRYGEERVRGHAEDLRRAALAAGTRPFERGGGVWTTLSLEVAQGDIVARVNGAVVARLHDATPQSAGRVSLGTSFDAVRFSNLLVERVPGHSPYHTALIDDMHLVRWEDSRTPVLVYDGAWRHENGQGMFTYMRTISTATQPGASLSHTFHGTGFDLFGPSDGTTLVDVLVDGRTVRTNEPLMPTNGSLRTMLTVSGLPYGRHTVTVRLVSGTLRVDAAAVAA